MGLKRRIDEIQWNLHERSVGTSPERDERSKNLEESLGGTNRRSKGEKDRNLERDPSLAPSGLRLKRRKRQKGVG